MLVAAIVSAVVLTSPLSERAPVLEDRVIFISPELYTPIEQVEHAVVGEIPSRAATRSEAERARLGARADAPRWIVVRFRDGLFAIDPFLPLPDATPEAARQLFKPMDYQTGAAIATLGTDRSLFDRKRIEATEDLFETLEHERVEWLKRHRYIQSVRSWSGDAGASQQTQTPARDRRTLPEDMPRTRPIEDVRAPSAGVLAVSGDQPVRISLPDRGVPASVRERVAAREGYLKRPAEKKAELAEAERAETGDSAER